MDQKQLRKAVASLGYYASKEDINHLFSLCDHDGDGTIDLDEMKRALNKFLKGEVPTPRPASRALDKSDRLRGVGRVETFARDLRGDGGPVPRGPESFDWDEYSKFLPTGRDPHAKEIRSKLWRTCDINGNGLVSLAEFDRGLIDSFGAHPRGSTMWRVCKAKQAIARAFHASRGLDKKDKGGKRAESSITDKKRGLDQDAFVSYAEFADLIHYLRQYMELWLMFEVLDSDEARHGGHAKHSDKYSGGGGERGDNSITLAEFVQAKSMLEAWGSTDGRAPFKIDDPAAEFATVDVDGSGAIRFDEFAKYALDKRLDLEDDDEVDDVALPVGNLADADLENANRRRDIAEQNAYFENALRAERRPLIRPTVATSPKARQNVPAPTSAVRETLQSPGSTAKLSPLQRHRAQRFVERYRVEYKRRMINEMREKVRQPLPERCDTLQSTNLLPLYESERMLKHLERMYIPPLMPRLAPVETFIPVDGRSSPVRLPEPSPPRSLLQSRESQRSFGGTSIASLTPAAFRKEFGESPRTPWEWPHRYVNGQDLDTSGGVYLPHAWGSVPNTPRRESLSP